MINITFSHFKNGTPAGFKIEGHAGYAEEGSDIICAAVSSSAYLVCNTITDIMYIDAAATERSGEMILKVPAESATKTKDILLGFKLHAEGLHQQYPDYVTITTTEV